MEIDQYEPAEIMPAPFSDVDGLNPDGGGLVTLETCGLCYGLVRWSVWEDHLKWHESNTST